MKLERLRGPTCGSPFPVYEDLVARLLSAHAPRAADGGGTRDPAVAHVLATCAGYAYADAATVAMLAGRLGLGDAGCVGITQVVDAMFIFSTAYLVQSHCGRVVVLCYRGTEAMNLGNWLGDADVGPESIALGGEELGVHAGFYRNVRTTRWTVLEELARALDGRSLLDPTRRVEHPLEALYVTGHSLGGAMALLFALSVVGSADHSALADRLRAVYTFGQPMAVVEPVPEIAREVGRAVFRHILPRDVIPALPPVRWGPFAHVGREYRYDGRGWQCAATPVAQLESVREIPRAVRALVDDARRRAGSRYTMDRHLPQHYIAALRPENRVTEYGDHG